MILLPRSVRMIGKAASRPDFLRSWIVSRSSVELGVGELMDLPEALLLGRVIAGQVGQHVDLVLYLARRRIVRLQIPLLDR